MPRLFETGNGRSSQQVSGHWSIFLDPDGKSDRFLSPSRVADPATLETLENAVLQMASTTRDAMEAQQQSSEMIRQLVLQLKRVHDIEDVDLIGGNKGRRSS